MTMAEIPASAIPEPSTLTFSTPCVFAWSNGIENLEAAFSDTSCTNQYETDPLNYWCFTDNEGGGYGYCDPASCQLGDFLNGIISL